MKLSKSTQKPARQKSKTMQIQTKEILQKNNNGNFQCFFFQFSCGKKSHDNKETLKNQKQIGEQTEFELASSKKLTPYWISLQKPQNEKKFLETTTNSGQKSFGNVFLNQSKISHFRKQQKLNSVSLTDRSYHQLNPSIDRKKYDLKINIEAEKILTKTRFSYMPLPSNSFKQNNPNQTTYSSNSSSSKPRVYFENNCVESKGIPSSTYNYNYLNDSHRQIHFLSNKHQSSSQNKIQFCIKPYHLSNGRKSYHLTQASTAKHDNQIQAHDATTSFQLINKTTEIFQNIQIQKPEKTQPIDLQVSNFSNYSSKYKDYMLKSLVNSARTLPQHQQNNIINLMKSARIQCDSIDQEQNQKQHSLKRQGVACQKQKFPGHFAKQIKFEDQNMQHLISISSSFAVIEDKQKEIQNTKNIYLHSLIDSSVKTDNKIVGLTQQSTINPQYSGQGIQDSNFMDENSLITQIHCLHQDLDQLASQQKDLKFQLESMGLSNLEELQKSIQQLQSLKLMSKERCRDLNILRQLLKVKKIHNFFDKSPTLKQKYLKDEKGWELYIEKEGQFEQLDLSDDTSETHNGDNQAWGQKQYNSLQSQFNS